MNKEDNKAKKDAGKKGKKSGSKVKEQMVDTSRKGGETVSKDKEPMADIGRRGGKH